MRSCSQGPGPTCAPHPPSHLTCHRASTPPAESHTIRQSGPQSHLPLAIPKVGLRLPSVAAAVGELYLADIGIPPHVLARAGIDNAQSLFASEEIVRIW